MTTVEQFAWQAADQGFEFEVSRYAAALTAHRGMRAALLRLRAVPLSFLDPAEPGTALAWLENGGTLSADGGTLSPTTEES
jgi:hypothetical protein